MDEERRKARVVIEEQAVRELRAHMLNEDDQKERTRRWHVGKEIPIAVIAAIVLQTVGVVWGAATLSARVDYIEKAGVIFQSTQSTLDRRQDDDSRRSEERIVTQLDKINVKLDRVIEAKQWPRQ